MLTLTFDLSFWNVYDGKSELIGSYEQIDRYEKAFKIIDVIFLQIDY